MGRETLKRNPEEGAVKWNDYKSIRGAGEVVEKKRRIFVSCTPILHTIH
jgi:hypothetical protein